MTSHVIGTQQFHRKRVTPNINYFAPVKIIIKITIEWKKGIATKDLITQDPRHKRPNPTKVLIRQKLS